MHLSSYITWLAMRSQPLLSLCAMDTPAVCLQQCSFFHSGYLRWGKIGSCWGICPWQILLQLPTSIPLLEVVDVHQMGAEPAAAPRHRQLASLPLPAAGVCLTGCDGYQFAYSRKWWEWGNEKWNCEKTKIKVLFTELAKTKGNKKHIRWQSPDAEYKDTSYWPTVQDQKNFVHSNIHLTQRTKSPNVLIDCPRPETPWQRCSSDKEDKVALHWPIIPDPTQDKFVLYWLCLFKTNSWLLTQDKAA